MLAMKRLKELGLAEQKLGGTGLSDEGASMSVRKRAFCASTRIEPRSPPIDMALQDGALVTISGRIKLAMASGCPYKAVFATAHRALTAAADIS
jgi:hypothetical protein